MMDSIFEFFVYIYKIVKYAAVLLEVQGKNLFEFKSLVLSV